MTPALCQGSGGGRGQRRRAGLGGLEGRDCWVRDRTRWTQLDWACRAAYVTCGALGNPPQSWMNALPLYAELQQGETAQVEDHLQHVVPDLRLRTPPDRYEDL